MSDETLALSTLPPVLPAQGDYDAICAALMRTERGRWFLQEYAKRNRHADTEVLLVAIGRIEAVVRADKGQRAHDSFRSDLLEMAKAITRTRAEVAEIKPEQPPPSTPRRRPPTTPIFSNVWRIFSTAFGVTVTPAAFSTTDSIYATDCSDGTRFVCLVR